MKELKRTQFGDPILRGKAQQLTGKEIATKAAKQLIDNMRHTLVSKKLGIGLAAPQVGKSIALVVIAIRSSKLRPKVKPFDLILINPEITETMGRQKQLWEGCISAGSNGKADLFAKVPRYPEVKVKYLDQAGKLHEQRHKGLKAQVIQHEVDHLNGILFVDHVKDTKSYMTHNEYLKAKRNKLL